MPITWCLRAGTNWIWMVSSMIGPRQRSWRTLPKLVPCIANLPRYGANASSALPTASRNNQRQQWIARRWLRRNAYLRWKQRYLSQRQRKAGMVLMLFTVYRSHPLSTWLSRNGLTFMPQLSSHISKLCRRRS